MTGLKVFAAACAMAVALVISPVLTGTDNNHGSSVGNGSGGTLTAGHPAHTG